MTLEELFTDDEEVSNYDYGLDRYDDTENRPQILKIIVDSEYAKEQLLKTSKYFHDLNIDTDYMMVNEFAHLYHDPDLIIVEQKG